MKKALFKVCDFFYRLHQFAMKFGESTGAFASDCAKAEASLQKFSQKCSVWAVSLHNGFSRDLSKQVRAVLKMFGLDSGLT